MYSIQYIYEGVAHLATFSQLKCLKIGSETERVYEIFMYFLLRTNKIIAY